MSDGLVLEELRAGYGRREIVHGISLEVSTSTCVLLLGTNGAGKTTLLGSIMGRVKRFGGSVRFEGRSLNGRVADSVREGVQLVPEGGRVFKDLSVADNLRLGAYLDRGADLRARVGEVTDLFPRLGERMSQRGSTLSGGERQMLAIGRALMARPRMLLLDEPFLGLAPIAIDGLVQVLRTINSELGIGLLIAEQDLKAVALAAQAHVIALGQISLTENDPVRLLDDDARVIQEQFFGA
jgi:branched-chain amino acid transport system ATP-binding protein